MVTKPPAPLRVTFRLGDGAERRAGSNPGLCLVSDWPPNVPADVVASRIPLVLLFLAAGDCAAVAGRAVAQPCVMKGFIHFECQFLQTVERTL
jgi:hypothetical protein